MSNTKRMRELYKLRDGYVLGDPVTGAETPDPNQWAREYPQLAAELEKLEESKTRERNPLNDDDYTTNDPQISDLKDLVGDLRGALLSAQTQIAQMCGMFNDEDGTIQECQDDIEDALEKSAEPN